jgi:hypothetical protein
LLIAKKGATVFGYYVKGSEQHGVAEIDKEGKVSGIEEIPSKARAQHARTGLYFHCRPTGESLFRIFHCPRATRIIWMNLQSCIKHEWEDGDVADGALGYDPDSMDHSLICELTVGF